MDKPKTPIHAVYFMPTSKLSSAYIRHFLPSLSLLRHYCNQIQKKDLRKKRSPFCVPYILDYYLHGGQPIRPCKTALRTPCIEFSCADGYFFGFTRSVHPGPFWSEIRASFRGDHSHDEAGDKTEQPYCEQLPECKGHSVAIVSSPTIPSTVIPFDRCQVMTALRVSAPKYPS